MVEVVRDVAGDGGMDLLDELHVEPPVAAQRQGACKVVGGLDVERPALLDVLNMGRVEIQGELCLLLREGAALDAVGAEDAGNDHLALKAISDLRKRRRVEPLMGVADTQERHLEGLGVNAHLEGETTEAGRVDLD